LEYNFKFDNESSFSAEQAEDNKKIMTVKANIVFLTVTRKYMTVNWSKLDLLGFYLQRNSVKCNL